MKNRIFVLAFALFALTAFAEETVSADTTQPAQPTTVAYYFYNTNRCSNCIKIENYTHAAITQSFAPQLESGKLAWVMKNLDEEENEHFIEDYQLYTKAVIFVEYMDGKQVKWKNAEKIWDHLADEAAFKDYITKELTTFLEVK
ncbi:hypothetical protein IT157_03665 [bacterium]|nr:hypothetical protein [bacterium]